MRILAVDDEPFILELMPMLAAKVGFPNMATAVSGHLALESLLNSADAFDCLVFDINMPEMDGIELCGRVRQIPSYRKTPIIMLTAMSERTFIDAAFKAGATDYATKPLDISELGARFRLAQEQLLAQRACEAARETRVASEQSASRRHLFDIPDAVAVDGVDNLIDFDPFRNYLTQITRAGLGALQLIAVKIDQITEIYDRTATDEFIQTLRSVARSVNDAFQKKSFLFSYAGNGAFLIASDTEAPLPPADIEREVQMRLRETAAGGDTGLMMIPDVSVGKPVHPKYGDVADVLRSAESALALAEARSEAKRGQHGAPESSWPGFY